MGENAAVYKNGTGAIRLSNWMGFTISGIVGFAAALVTITLTFADVRSNATAAGTRATENAAVIHQHDARLRTLETQAAAAATWRDNTSKQLNRIENLLESLRGR